MGWRPVCTSHPFSLDSPKTYELIKLASRLTARVGRDGVLALLKVLNCDVDLVVRAKTA
jgi:hypothetical protein